MTALAVVENLDVVKYGVGEFGFRFPLLAVKKFNLHARPE